MQILPDLVTLLKVHNDMSLEFYEDKYHIHNKGKKNNKTTTLTDVVTNELPVISSSQSLHQIFSNQHSSQNVLLFPSR